jgi:glycosyltransferase involved in cell wall biosynthesis
LNLAARVRFAGQSDRPQDWYPQMDIFALSSDTEQMPLGVLEAMAAGLLPANIDSNLRPFPARHDQRLPGIVRIPAIPRIARSQRRSPAGTGVLLLSKRTILPWNRSSKIR